MIEDVAPAPPLRLKWESKTVPVTVETKIELSEIAIDQGELKEIIANHVRNKYLLTPQCKITVEFFDFDRTEDAANVTIIRNIDNG